MFDELLNLQGDTGAKAIIKKHSDKTAKVHMPEAAFDVDTYDDKLRLKKH
jgi:molybdenum cofactor cytidylyltransferase